MAVEDLMMKAQKEAAVRSAQARKVASAVTKRTIEEGSKPQVQAAAAGAAGGAAAVGTGLAATGLVAGGAVGAAIGILPAIFTFGLSIPIGAAIGGGCGLVAGGAVGTTAGLTGGGAVGYFGYTKRAEIKSKLLLFREKIFDLKGKVARDLNSIAKKTRTKFLVFTSNAKATAMPHVAKAKAKASETYTAVKGNAFSNAAAMNEKAKSAAGIAKEKAVTIASNKTVQVTSAGAASGAVVVGTGGAGAGFLTGGAVGAAIGVVPAIFTFGLSIPVCAVIGSGLGTAAGAVGGGAVGASLGGLGGFGFTRRETIKSSVTENFPKVKEQAIHSAEYLRSKLSGTTGGTA